jgi:hypothetical protein
VLIVIPNQVMLFTLKMVPVIGHVSTDIRVMGIHVLLHSSIHGTQALAGDHVVQAVEAVHKHVLSSVEVLSATQSMTGNVLVLNPLQVSHATLNHVRPILGT